MLEFGSLSAESETYDARPESKPIGQRSPYPIPFYGPLGLTRLLRTHNCAVIFFIPANRIEHITALWRAAIFERLAIDNVTRHLFQNISGLAIRCGRSHFQFLERVGELPVRQAVAFQRAGNCCGVHGGLAEGSLCQRR